MTAKTKGVLNGFLDRGARLEGTLVFDDMFRIDGALKGSVVSEHELVIGDAGEVDGEIRVGRLAVSGTVRGVVYAKERIEVHAGAKVYAELHTPTLTVEEGATIQGPVETGPQLVAAPRAVELKDASKDAKKAVS
jgi:cytoskeletal protein CcmA (bactofilin family)